MTYTIKQKSHILNNIWDLFFAFLVSRLHKYTAFSVTSTEEIDIEIYIICFFYYKYSVNYYYYCLSREVTEFMDGCGLDRGKRLQVHKKFIRKQWCKMFKNKRNINKSAILSLRLHRQSKWRKLLQCDPVQLSSTTSHRVLHEGTVYNSAAVLNYISFKLPSCRITSAFVIRLTLSHSFWLVTATE